MSNDDVYAGGLLKRAPDPATQPPGIQAFLRAELLTSPGDVPRQDSNCNGLAEE